MSAQYPLHPIATTEAPMRYAVERPAGSHRNPFRRIVSSEAVNTRRIGVAIVIG
jgi:hypothetical protein